MKAYSRYLYQATKGQNTWTKYLLMLIFAWAGPKLLQLLLIEFLNQINASASTLYHLAETNFINNLLTIGLLFFLIKTLHKRAPESIINTRGSVRWDRLGFGFLVSAGLVFFLSAVSLFLLYDQPLIFKEASEGDFARGWFEDLLYIPMVLLMYHLFFGAYLLQGIAIWLKKPLQAILLVGLISYLFSHGQLIWLFLTGSLGREISLSWFLNVSVFVEFLLLALVILDDGIELALGFSLGKGLYSIFVNESAIHRTIFPDDTSFSEGFVFSFSFGWGLLLVVAIYLYIISKRYPLNSYTVLREPIPPPADDAFDLIDEIGK